MERINGKFWKLSLSPGEIHLAIKKAVKFAEGGFGASVEYSTFEMEVLDQVIVLVEVCHYRGLTLNSNYPYLHPQVLIFQNPSTYIFLYQALLLARPVLGSASIIPSYRSVRNLTLITCFQAFCVA